MKPLITMLAFLAGLVPTMLSAQDLPLAERRALASYQESVFPAQQSAIRAAAGFDVPLDIRWNAITRPGEAERLAREGHFTKVYFTPLIEALKAVASDQMGKDALKAKLTKIVVTYDKETAPISNYPTGLSFEGGALTINFEPGVNENDIKPRADAIRKLLESKL